MNILKQPILIVEDSDDDVFFVQRALKDAGVKNALYRVADGQQALDYLAGEGAYSDRSHYPLPGLVLLDLQLPQKTGMDVLAWIRARPDLQKVVVVVLTTSEHPKDIVLAYKLGARSYLVKPPTAQQLKELVESLKVCWVGFSDTPIDSQSAKKSR